MSLTRIYDRYDMGNVYILGEEGGPCIVFDFGDNRGHKIEAYIARHHNGQCAGVFLTHAHYDHIYGLGELYPDQKWPIFIAEDEKEALFDKHLNCSDLLFDDSFKAPENLNYYAFDDDDEITVGPFLVRCILTPFHTRGSAVFYLEEQGMLFTGDTLFKGSIGRDDLPGAAPRKRDESLRKILALPPSTRIYPGHGPSSTLEKEMMLNPFLQGLKG